MYSFREDIFEREEGGNYKRQGTDTMLEPESNVRYPDDDTSAREQPSRHVDYLSHEWTEEDAWSSYKFIRATRKLYPNSTRLENASWRTWEQKRRNLQTISPENVRWLKDHDVTWLYGPLHPGSRTSSRSSSLDRSSPNLGFVAKKPCLKKRTLSEEMLLRSVSSAALVRETSQRPLNYRNFIPRSDELPSLTRSSTCPESSISSSGASSPPLSFPKSVRFHEKVEQRIALPDIRIDELQYYYDSDDEDLVEIRTSRVPSPTRKGFRSSMSSKTIERLPHTLLKSPVPERRMDTGMSLPPSVKTKHRPTVKLISTVFSSDFKEVEVDEWKAPSSWANAQDKVEKFQEALEVIKQESKDNTAFALSCNSLFLAPTLGINTQNHSSLAEEEQCWSADIDLSPTVDSFPLGPDEYEHIDSVPVLSFEKSALVSHVMDEFWVVFNAKDQSRNPATLSSPIEAPRGGHWAQSQFTSTLSFSARALADHEQSLRQSLPLFVRQKVEDLVREQERCNEEYILAQLATIIQDCQDKVLAAYQSEDYISSFSQDSYLSCAADSPSTASDSGYGSEKDVIRDTSCIEKEKEKMVKEWELYSNSWDDDETLAWESSF